MAERWIPVDLHNQSPAWNNPMPAIHNNSVRKGVVWNSDVLTPPPSPPPSTSSSLPPPLPPPRREGSMNDYLAWFDGACEPVNPGGTASFGVVIKDNAGTVLVKEHGIAGKGRAMSNNLAEYAGVLHILKYLSSRPPGRATIHGDSNLVINQLSGRWRIRKGLYLSIATESKELLAHLSGLGWQINLCWIPRAHNSECDALSRTDAPRHDRNSSLLPALG